MKNSKKFLLAILSAAMLTGSFAAIPASADYTTKANKEQIVQENFDNKTLEAEYSQYDRQVGEYIKYRNNHWDSAEKLNVGQKYEIKDGRLVLDALSTRSQKDALQNHLISVVPKETIQLEKGNTLHINFDASFESSTVDTPIGFRVKANGTASNDFKFETLSGTAVNNNNVAANAYTNYKSAFMTFETGKGAMFGNMIAGGGSDKANYAKNNVNVDITVNPYDESQNDAQTVKTTFTYTTDTGEKVTESNYSKLDANYTGADDSSFEKISSVDSLDFYISWGDKTKFTLDNVLVEKINYTKEYYKAAKVKNIIDCDFSKGVGFSMNNVNAQAVYQIGAQDNAYFRDSWGAQSIGTVEKVKGPDGKAVYAFKQQVSTGDKNGMNRLMFKNPNGSTPVNDGDIIRFSYDLKHDSHSSTGGGSYGFSPVLNKPRYEYDFKSSEDYVSAYHPQNGGNSSLEDKYTIVGRSDSDSIIDAQGIERNSFLLDYESEQWSDGKKYTALLGRRSWGNNETSITDGAWHHYDFIINTADKSKDGKQTIKVYVDKGTQNEVVFYNTLDFNVLKNTEDKITEFTTLEMTLKKKDCNDVSGIIYSTNYKLDIITPSFGISGDAISNNDPEDGITLEPGNMKVECVLNVPGTDKKTTDSDYPKYNYTIYAAQYDDNTLVDVKPFKREFSEDNYKTTIDVDVIDGANSLKLFVFDENLHPLVVNETAAVNGSAASHSISYSLKPTDMH